MIYVLTELNAPREWNGEAHLDVYFPVSITRYLSDDPQPGLVECELIDAQGQCWRFVDKSAIFSSEELTTHKVYPRPGVIAGVIIRRRQNEVGREVVLIDTERPWDVESVDGTKCFEVFGDTLIPSSAESGAAPNQAG